MSNHCTLSRKILWQKWNQKIDEYRANLASELLPGQGHIALHNQFQHVVQDMMKLGNIDSITEAANFLINKVGQPYIGDYTNHLTSQPDHPKNVQDAIVPNLHATNYPTGSQIINDSRASRSAEVIFEIKTFTICKTRYDHDNRLVNLADCSAKEVANKYNLKFKKSDILFASGIVDGRNDIIRPF
jgi:hypothetical protein